MYRKKLGMIKKLQKNNLNPSFQKLIGSQVDIKVESLNFENEIQGQRKQIINRLSSKNLVLSGTDRK